MKIIKFCKAFSFSTTVLNLNAMEKNFINKTIHPTNQYIQYTNQYIPSATQYIQYTNQYIPSTAQYTQYTNQYTVCPTDQLDLINIFSAPKENIPYSKMNTFLITNKKEEEYNENVIEKEEEDDEEDEDVEGKKEEYILSKNVLSSLNYIEFFIENNCKNNKKKRKRKKKNKLKNYNIRKGDWLCPKCNNINFSFRTECNHCKIKKPLENI